MHEVYRILTELLDSGGDIEFKGNGNSAAYYVKMLESSKLVLRDHPDAYIKNDDEIWLIEHFEFDCYKRDNKGSKSRQELARIDRMFDNSISSLEETVFNETIRGDARLKFYEDNLKRNFNSHYNRIDDYKSFLVSEGIILEGMSIKMMFLIEETSPVGTNVLQGNILQPVLLHQCKWFLDMLSGSPNLDYVLAVYPDSKGFSSAFIDRNDLLEYYRETIDFSKVKYIPFIPSVVGGVISS